MELKNKRILLTGATGGIGRELAFELNSQGAELILVGRNENRLKLIAEKLNNAHIIQADISTEQGLEGLINALANAKLDGVINAAGLNQFSTLNKTDKHKISQMLDTNLLAPMVITQSLLSKLKNRPSAFILNVGSTFGSIGFAGYSAYCATKFGLRGFTESLRRELSGTSIKVLYIAPRATKTEMNSEQVAQMNLDLGVNMDSPIVVAQQIIQAIKTNKEETYLGWPEKVFVRLNALIPSLVDKSLAKQLPIIEAYSQHQVELTTMSNGEMS